MDDTLFYGRLVTWPQSEPIDREHYQLLSAFVGNRCQRCGQDDRASLPNGGFYCLACLNLGRVASHDVLLTLAEPNDFPAYGKMPWTGQLTASQGRVSQELIDSYQKGEDRLVWAVTGAGKTEMLFPLLEHALQGRGRVAVLSPRVDVVLELAPRLRAAFGIEIQVLHGHQEEPYQYGQFVLATTHQALRFRQAFDLIVIDEVDAFPYRGDPVLNYAVNQARKQGGVLVYLTATPTPDLLRQVRQGKLRQSYLPRRFHQGLLPQIQTRKVGNWRKRCPQRLKVVVLAWQQEQIPFLVFVPQVKDLANVDKCLQKVLKIMGGTVHAGDPDRAAKVLRLRSGDWRYLVTTTILERGVTLPGLEVVILGADDPVFSTAALVQIAGRVARAKEKPTGLVLALIEEPTLVLRRAQQQIDQLNQLAEEMGGQS
ncbi:ATP-dependent DNA helicase/translocase [Fructobacillus pseudoficulneus]|uniref:ATP-dependent DNA helicase/translocase n=1 Tax=Fructobacillus pseudoficulneus TaxID=220714 RepID=A0A3F3H480_9LACO|nr:helicase-related protein [Fructobacillus pseudoficulneus]GAP03168.1 ATP-dependent DNA helicase/translocase [Fructobacillus pseudoficulneus]SEH40890.1 competence protein ComFA [Fructobacillus pseudoficulneus]